MKSLLIVDDQPGIRLLLSEVFSKEGLETRLASNGVEALNLVGERKPDCVLLDMKMPGMDGIEVLKRIKQKNPYIPVFMMTAYGETELTEQATQHGAEQYFTKPFNIYEVRDAVMKVIASRK
ncbi:response regulator [Sporosarcina highlanderae]|uniref:Response regulator n=1 Tax=Sporosarcina highlanderae TaxID=3035916 RepID=A0ABT8JLJ2_9BACL|nr:response regulator [Sporosarcina highlanderae]MDN4606020.1 response regulator [Sporosarcina highlanderae]